MKAMRLLITAAALVMLCPVDADAQLGKRLLEKAKNAAERVIEDKTEKAVEKAVDKATDLDTYKSDGKDPQQQAGAPADAGQAPAAGAPQQSLEMTYAKNDFVPGDEIIFDDPMDAEQLGEFPSMWDLYAGNAEVASVGGKKAVLITSWNDKIGPLMKEPRNYLGDVFTVEYDFLVTNNEEAINFLMTFHPADQTNRLMYIENWLDREDFSWSWQSSNGEQRGSGEKPLLSANTWHHVSISFNKRAWKLYINGVRYINVPNVANPPGWFEFGMGNGNFPIYITNMRIAKGAVPLYDRMMSEGKFISYGITFDLGKSTIKPESMGEINRIVQLMNENPTLRFSVEGHTDSTGNAASNQTLSEARSKAIVARLTELGIAADRLSASGKGQNNPIADNSTDEGRAKNRRVEFVKL